MELILAFLAKSVVNTILGHYVKKGLSKIDENLLRLFELGDTKAIERYVTEKGIEGKVLELATSTVENSLLIPLTFGDELRNEDMVALFRHVLDIGFKLSYTWRFDLLLPGSVIGPNTFTLFTQNADAPPDLRRSGVQLYLPTSNIKGRCWIFPTRDQGRADSDELWVQYVSMVKNLRKETNDYLYVDRHFRFLEVPSKWCFVGLITAGFAQFPSGLMIKDERKELLGLEHSRAQLADWAAGIALLLGSTANLTGISHLTKEDVESLRKLAEQANEVISRISE